MKVGMPIFVREKKELEDRFWEKVDKKGDTECWNWKGGANTGGYGSFWLEYKTTQAHRFAYMLVHGDISEKLEVCHNCDNPLCVNPNHLFLGTQKDNIRDRDNKGRGVVGEKNGRAKLTWQDITDIRGRNTNGEKISEIAKDYDVSLDRIYRIINNEVWKDDNYKLSIHVNGNTGENHGSAKLNWNSVHQIKERCRKGETQAKIAKEFGVGKSIISDIVNNKKWKE